VYDITKRDTFENIEKWLQETENFANEYMVLMLVGNKSDLETE
jgi:GTPase SAR1 family protein